MHEPSSGRFENGAHYLPVRIYYEDTDFSGAVYHANYLKFFERGRSDFLRAAGVGHVMLLQRPDPCAFAVTHIDMRFLRAATIDDALQVRTKFCDIRGPRIIIEQALLRGETTLCTASVEICCVTPSQNGAGSARRPPKELLEALKPYLSA
ncbi:MAG: YbgC/FadM family acyl-CoA thioesterase [Caulobacterales bacterium]